MLMITPLYYDTLGFIQFTVSLPHAVCSLQMSHRLSLGSYHTETNHLHSSLLVLIKKIIVKFLLKITILKIQSYCFGLKRSRKRPTDCSLAFSRLFRYIIGSFENEALENEDRSTKHPNLENEAP